jgi:putative transposase
MKVHQRRSIRLPEFDYSQPGAYFVTFVVNGRQPILSEVNQGRMILSGLGQAVEQAWYELPRHYPHLVLDEFVVMPNHVHAVMVLTEAGGSTFDEKRAQATRRALPEIVRALKSYSARSINQIRCTPGQVVWQRSFYDHIIRNQAEWDRIRMYIQNNPSTWETDEENQTA